MSNLRGNVAIVGTAESDLGLVAPDMTPFDLMAQGTMRALDDCGLTLQDVDRSHLHFPNCSCSLICQEMSQAGIAAAPEIKRE